MKSTAEQDELGLDFFQDVTLKVAIPRRARMKDQVRKESLSLDPEDAQHILALSHVLSLETSRPSSVPGGARRPSCSPAGATASSWNVAASESEVCAGWSRSPWL